MSSGKKLESVERILDSPNGFTQNITIQLLQVLTFDRLNNLDISFRILGYSTDKRHSETGVDCSHPQCTITGKASNQIFGN